MSTKDEQIVKVEGKVLVREGGKQAIYAVDTTPGEAGRPCTLLIAPEGSTQVPRYFSEGEVKAKDERIALLEGMLYEAAGYADEVTDSEGAEEFAQRCRAIIKSTL